MNQPIAHKLAPFLDTPKPECEGPIAAYASYAAAPHPLLLGEGDFDRSKSGAGLNPEHLHLTSQVDFQKTVYTRDFDLLLDLFCVDHDSYVTLYYLFASSRIDYRFLLSLDVQNDEHAPSLSARYAIANWLERECFDFFGVRFDGHPALKRLIMYPEFAGHPLRKCYPIDKDQPLIPIYA